LAFTTVLYSEAEEKQNMFQRGEIRQDWVQGAGQGSRDAVDEI